MKQLDIARRLFRKAVDPSKTILHALCVAVVLAIAPLTADAQSTPSTAEAPAVSAPAAPSAPASEAAPAENPYGLKALWEQGDIVAKLTLAILVIMSIGSWTVIVTKLLEQNKAMRHSRETDNGFWSANTLVAGTQTLNEDSPFRYVAEKGLESLEKHSGVRAKVDLHTWVSLAVQRAVSVIQGKTQGGLAFLATVGSTAPFVGLFGTVWGIYHALVKIGMSGQASIDKVAGPVGEALIMTAIGLAVAVPAVLGYNWLVRRNKAVMEKVHDFSNELHAVLLAQADR